MCFWRVKKFSFSFYLVLTGTLVLSVPVRGQAIYIAAYQTSPTSGNYIDIDLHVEEFWGQTTFRKLGSVNDNPTIDGPSTKIISGADFLESIRAESREGILVVVHGFDTTLERALWLALDVSKHAGRQGAIVLFYWPSYASLFEYRLDTKRARDSAGGLAVLLIKLSALQQNTPVLVDLLSFSLGSILALNAMIAVPVSGYTVIIAPAIDQRDLPRHFSERLTQLTRDRVTVYESNEDLALQAASILGGDPMGRTPRKLPGWDVVDVSAVCAPSFWAFFHPWSKIERSHYYLSCPAVARDIEQVFNGLGPKERKLRFASEIWRLQPN